ncbi:glycine zipper family protein [Nitrosospira multiformis]|uniref:Glycine zipper domain-containing protein n=1 Tax=Nitrosospira multiformis (strain ATCC 25196 / NCIMB 11849 / C 71) TaxID=323848 RepID=Q2YCQ8_NITMU|nr:glycine zipper family protein [Nitrosospira multiformis]ABB73463.1 hypothetical protein Nmul_A0154 [Nitrosospira multiformis ATCC 25196]SEA60332.1 hypothetical protein SAMN05216411_11423 [Nitrosospira multiformis]SEG10434.1 hypothetical protein SAMN05216403_13015 [Nitrosospira multiformis ATCC 25196]
MSNEAVNYWKFATIGILLVGASVASTLFLTGRDSDSKPELAASAAETEAVSAGGETPVSEAGKKPLASVPEPAPIAQAAPEPPKRPRVTQSNQNAAAAVPPSPSYAPPAAYPPQPVRSSYPSQSVMNECNRYASEQVNSKAEEVLKNAALGAALGAAVGAAGGAIAGGGKGAGKGAAIGSITGVAGGTLYGLNETKSHDGQYQAAYSSCMRAKGY